MLSGATTAKGGDGNDTFVDSAATETFIGNDGNDSFTYSAGNDVMDAGNFFRLHRLYLAISTGQCCATLVYLWASLALWGVAENRNGSKA